MINFVPMCDITMYGRILQCCIFMILYLNVFCTEPSSYKVLYYEYGAHIEGEEVSYTFTGVVPAFTPNYYLNITPHRPGMESKFTYLRAEYINVLSKVTISFNPATFILNFHVKFPFVNMPIGVVGYSMPILHIHDDYNDYNK